VSGAGIVGLGLWVPDEIRTNDAWGPGFVAEFEKTLSRRSARDFTALDAPGAARAFEHLFVKHALPHERDPFKGATARRASPADLRTAECDARAARRALEDAELDPRDVDLVVSSAIVQDRLIPSNGPTIQHLVGCTRAAGIGVEAVCSSALAQLDLAASLVETGRARHVLCVQSHQIARINDLSLPFSPLFGDASGAFVVGPVAAGRGLLRVTRDGDGSLVGGITHAYKETPGACWYRDASGPVHPGSDDVEAARYVGRNLIRFAAEAILDLCEGAGVPLDAVAALAMIQPAVWYQAAVAEAIGIAPHRAPSTYARLAHVGAAGVVSNLLEAREQGLLGDGAPVVLYAHGAGLTRYAALLRWEQRAARRHSA
jgi:3-oxoacyl-[acyl-carrier-protein] synthase-3